MSEYAHERDCCGEVLDLFMIHRLISKGYEVSGVRESELTLVSHPLQADMIRGGFGWLAGKDGKALFELIEDANLNPFRRIKAWLTDRNLPPSEVYIETPKGKCRLYNLSTICL